MSNRLIVKVHRRVERDRTWVGSVALALGFFACSVDTSRKPGAAADSGGSSPAADGGRSGSPAATVANAGTTPASAGASGDEAGRAARAAAAGSGGAMTVVAAGASAMPAAGTAGTQATGGSPAPDAAPCTRDLLKTTVDGYFTALAAHDPKLLPLAQGVKFTENGETLPLGEGLWASAGPVKFKESLFDVEQCGTVTQSVVPDGSTDIPVALRLKLQAHKLTEIETIAVRSGDYIVASNTANMIALMANAWGDTVPPEQRQTRAELEKWIDKYFRLFPMGGCNLASDCKRMENGFSLACTAGATCSNEEPTGSAVMKPRLILVDVEAGMAAGFTMFQGRYSDVHMIKYSDGQVHGVHTVLGEAKSSGWD